MRRIIIIPITKAKIAATRPNPIRSTIGLPRIFIATPSTNAENDRRTRMQSAPCCRGKPRTASGAGGEQLRLTPRHGGARPAAIRDYGQYAGGDSLITPQKKRKNPPTNPQKRGAEKRRKGELVTQTEPPPRLHFDSTKA